MAWRVRITWWIMLYTRYSRIFWVYVKKHGEKINDNNNPSIATYINKIENRIMLKIKTGYYLELLIRKTMKLLGSTNNMITKNENGGNVPYLEITEVVLVHCYIVSNDYQQDSRVLYKVVLNKSFGQLLDISPKNYIILKIFDSEFSYSEVWFTDQDSKPLEVEDRISMNLVINWSVKYKKWRTIQFKLDIEYL